MKLTQIAVLLSGVALSASVLAADPFFSGTTPRYNVDETKPATQVPVRFGDENDTSWMTPQSKPAFGSNAAASADNLGLPNDLDENALASGTATYGATKHIFAGYGARGNGAGL